ncbi:MAG: hypothetical protein WDW38_003451 [Sanguina aurantia]
MAETVRYLMEEMIPELEDLEKKGYFSNSEIKQVVQKRQDFEYLLKRRTALKTDYYRYIEYESKLEELRRYRKKRGGIKGKKGLAEMCMIRRIHFIYERATRKFKADLQLWLKWVEFCKRSDSTKQLSKVITKALQRHASVAALWIEAAVWEFEHNSNVSAARTLMQQGLRTCKADEQMWAQYLRMELLYVAKLRARRKVLGVSSAPAAAAATDTGPDADAAEDSVMETGGDLAVSLGTDAAEAEAAAADVLQGGVAKVVLKAALAALPASLAARKALLTAMAAVTFPGVKRLRHMVYDDLAENFQSDGAAWDLRARRHCPHEGAPFEAAAHGQVLQVYQQGLAALGELDGSVHEHMTNYLGETLEDLLAQAADQDTQMEAAVGVGAQLLSACQDAHSKQAMSAAMYVSWANWADRLGQPKMALKVSRLGCERHPTSADVWELRLAKEVVLADQLAIGSSDPSGKGRDKLMACFRTALAHIPAEASPRVWLQALNATTPGSSQHTDLSNLLVTALSACARGATTGGMGHVAAAFVQKVWDTQGASSARVLYKRLMRGPALGASTPGSSSGSSAAATTELLTELHEAALSAYGESEADLWLSYALYEVQQMRGGGDHHVAGNESPARSHRLLADVPRGRVSGGDAVATLQSLMMVQGIR